MSRTHILVVLAVVAVVAASFFLPGVFDDGDEPTGSTLGSAAGVEQGTGLPADSPVPSFTERDVLTGEVISSSTLGDATTLLFFSEGVMCQACLEQIRDLEQVGAELAERGIQLVSITPDSTADLEQAVEQYGITTPVISDSDRTMSQAFNTLGKGMHSDTPGHAFALIDKGTVVWYRDYWLPPYRTMYVPPKQLLDDIPPA